MNSRPLIWIGMIVGSTVGGFVPALWGDSMFSMSSIILSTIGGVAGIVIGFKISH